jgi:tetratricopeptide (TPR) repeat protein
MANDHPPNDLFKSFRERLFGTQQAMADAANKHLAPAYWLDGNYIGKIERGVVGRPSRPRCVALRTICGVETDAEIGLVRRSKADTGRRVGRHHQDALGVQGRTKYVANLREHLEASHGHSDDSQPAHTAGNQTSTDIALGPRLAPGPDFGQIELVRQGLNEVLGEGAMAEAGLDEWEQTVTRHGRATRDRAAGMLLDDLCADLAELQRAVRRHRSASALRRLSRVTAQMSGLMCLTLCKLDQRTAFRQWARTARMAAREAGDPETHSWILAQEAYGHFYSSDMAEAIDVAQQAQSVVRAPCVGAALAAALEARAYAVMKIGDETRAALGRAQDNLSGLKGDMLSSSAFGYNEAQFRFHEGNAYTHLGDLESAFVAQDRALKLCSPSDYTDWALTRLDRAACLASRHDAVGSMNYAIATIAALSEGQRRGIITLRGQDVLNSLPANEAKLPAARDLHELLMITTERKEVVRP